MVLPPPHGALIPYGDRLGFFASYGGFHCCDNIVESQKVNATRIVVTVLAVDYRPVFETGRASLAELTADPDTGQAVRSLAEVVARVEERVTGLRHDLLGRILPQGAGHRSHRHPPHGRRRANPRPA